MSKNNKKKKQKAEMPLVRQAIAKKAEGGISGKELKEIKKDTGRSSAAIVQAIDAINRNRKGTDKPGIALNAGAANKIIKGGNAASAGTGRIAKTLQSMTGTPGSPGYMRQGQMVGVRESTPSRLVTLGEQIRSGGRIGNKPQPTPEVKTRIISKEENPPTKRETAPNPDQESLDKIAALETLLGERDAEIERLNTQPNFQDMFNQQQLNYDQQMATLSDMFNQQIAGMQNMYGMQIQQQDLLAQQEQEAARAFMINQGRMMNPANLQIGATYGTPQLAGTQGFKSPYRSSSVTPAQAATAFTAPTLAATAATTPMTTQIPTVLNV